MATFRVIGTGPNREHGTITHNLQIYKPGDVFPAKDDTASEETIAALLKAGQLEQVDGRTLPKAPAPK